MDPRKIQLPRELYTGPGMIYNTGEICQGLRFEGNPFVLSGKNTMNIAGKKVIENLEDKGYSCQSMIVDSATKKNVEKVKDNLDDSSFILGVGGGKVIDVAKLAATLKDIPFISVPTAASHDGISSPRASIIDSEKKSSYKATTPIGVIADTEIISKAPFRLLCAGCGDIISNYTALKDWDLAKRLLNVDYSESAYALSLMTAKLILQSSKYIKEGLEESARIVVKSLISSSMAISIAGSSRPASGSEHKFSHALDIVAKKPALHGEQCGIGTIMMMNLQGGDWMCIKNALTEMHVPTTAKELGLSDEEIIKALTIAHTINKDRYTILGDRGLTEDAAEKLAKETEVIS